jgi:hypothetical protein
MLRGGVLFGLDILLLLSGIRGYEGIVFVNWSVHVGGRGLGIEGAQYGRQDDGSDDMWQTDIILRGKGIGIAATTLNKVKGLHYPLECIENYGNTWQQNIWRLKVNQFISTKSTKSTETINPIKPWTQRQNTTNSRTPSNQVTKHPSNQAPTYPSIQVSQDPRPHFLP